MVFFLTDLSIDVLRVLIIGTAQVSQSAEKKGSVYAVCHFPIQTEKLQVDHPFMPIIYFV
ncbi:hypothetical protein BCR42DRAFT_430135, partial [Absidia repens]